MRDKTRDRILERFSGKLKDPIKGLLERLMLEERAIYLEEHPTKANGYYTRDLLTLFGPIEELWVPRVRGGDFHPKLIPYRKRTSIELSEAILLLYASGVSARGISRFLEAVYWVFYSPQSISRLAEVAAEEVEEWRSRPLYTEYYAVYLDCTFLSVRRGKTAKEPVYVALGLKPDGSREILGFWTFGAEGESSHNWETILKELWERGVRRVRLFISDDLPGIEEAIRGIFPQAKWQLCVVHAVRDALSEVRKNEREEVAEDLKAIYRADTEKQTHKALEAFKAKWASKYPKIVARWTTKNYALLAFLEHPKPIRRYLYTTNQLERLIKEVKRRMRTVETLCNPGTLEKILYLVLSQMERKLARRLVGFAELQMGSGHASETH
ncbi:MAG: IS256 family transposase [Caldiserica bacterium]|nr:IS256 family transposase [Caldisericota bacterium]